MSARVLVFRPRPSMHVTVHGVTYTVETEAELLALLYALAGLDAGPGKAA